MMKLSIYTKYFFYKNSNSLILILVDVYNIIIVSDQKSKNFIKHNFNFVKSRKLLKVYFYKL